MKSFALAICCVAWSCSSSMADEARVQALLKTIAEVGPQGTGSPAARAARDELAQQGLEILPQLFLAMDTRNVVAANWYRTVYEEIVVREQASVASSWPTAFLENYLNEVHRSGRARRLALSLIERLDRRFAIAGSRRGSTTRSSASKPLKSHWPPEPPHRKPRTSSKRRLNIVRPSPRHAMRSRYPRRRPS